MADKKQEWQLTYDQRQAGLEVALESDAARTPAAHRHRAVAARAEGETGRTAAGAKRRGAQILIYFK
jgi:hypothetical protein